MSYSSSLLCFLLSSLACNTRLLAGELPFHKASTPLLQYTGRIDYTDPEQPRLWNAGSYVLAGVRGDSCAFIIRDQHRWGKNRNYLEIVVDRVHAYRIQLKQDTDTIGIALSGGPDARHQVMICKNTEANIGYIAVGGVLATALIDLPAPPARRIEFIGNSITCGTGSDQSAVPCDKGEWYDQHNAYFSYGPVTARVLGANWHLSSVSGIGLMHSCCDMSVIMPQVFDKINMAGNELVWDFSRYIPDVVTICLGQNDGIQDSASFCSNYEKFIGQIRSHYPKATIICLSSPMADSTLLAFMKKSLGSLVAARRRSGDQKVHAYFFSRRYHAGCGDHPSLEEHRQIAAELTGFIGETMGWKSR